jgi:hypothetical protein
MISLAKKVPTARPVTYKGSAALSIGGPTKLKIQLTGPGAEVLLDEGPASGKRWQRLVVSVYAEEVDA